MPLTHPWNSLLTSLPNPHFLQTYEWGQVKAAYGWVPLYLFWTDEKFHLQTEPSLLPQAGVKAAALVLKKNIIGQGFAAHLSVLYCPKGPVLDWADAPLQKRVLDDLQALARRQGAVFLKLDPDLPLGTGIPGSEGETTDLNGSRLRGEISRRGWQFSSEQIQFQNTVILSLEASEEEMLARMKQKTRYNVRLAAKKGVELRVGSQSDWATLYQMYAETSLRDGFVIREEAYYRKVWQIFLKKADSQNPIALPLIAEVEGSPVAAIFLFLFAGRAYYVYGMSREAHREKMPTYLLQWEAMKWAKAQGCTHYDLWGAPDVFDETDGMWGVFRFKEGLGGVVLRTLGAWDYVPNPFWYALYTKVVPKILDVMRSRGKAATRQKLER